ncbi:hypothetical protein UFOVP249_74 [uncultured Caudovirales phage]|uniref:Uncharacterized protein n=1 Tax=uncultured Caudovirales phage TaxID=2100421 RepID=A0A6J5LHH7_9CAUD|nr:hypothetical protein UFOVP249_74 [uncultured Caudovirales phage]
MNERIKQLAEQASLELFNDTAHHRLLKGFAEKFAKLIVKECVQVIKDCEKYGCDKPLEFEVMEHFGVEE